MRRFGAAMTAAVMLIGSLAIAEEASASTLTSSYHVLPISTFRHIAVDDAHNHVFVSDGQHSIVVRTLAGAAVTTITGEDGADGLALSPDGSTLYVALTTPNVIQAIDTSLLSESARYSTGDGTCPSSVAALGTNVWFGYGGCTAGQGIGVIDLTQQTPAAVTGISTALDASILATSSALPGRLFAGERGGSTVSAFDISGATLTFSSSVPVSNGGGNLKDIAVSPDGTNVFAASGSPYYIPEWLASDLSPVRNFGSNLPYPDAVAVASTGQVAGGFFAWYDKDVRVYTPGATQLHAFEFSLCCGTSYYDYPVLADAGLAFTADASRLYAVSTDDSLRVTLHIYNNATLPSSTMTLSGPSKVTRATTVSLSGKLSSQGVGVGATPLTVKKTDLDGTHTLPGVITSNDGSFVVHDTPRVGGTNTYTVSWVGDSTRLGITKTFKVAVSRVTTALSLKPNRSIYNYGATESVTVHLGATYNASLRAVSIYAKQVGGNLKLLKSGKVNSYGNLSASVAYSHNLTFTAKYAGDERYAPRTVSVGRKVRVKVNSAIAGYYTKSGGYYLFHQSKGGGFGVKVFPNKASEPVEFRMQAEHSGVWKTVSTYTADLNQYSVAGASFNGRTYTPLRIRVEFHGDHSNAPDNSKWWYVQFR
jgi:hypothetical protein